MNEEKNRSHCLAFHVSEDEKLLSDQPVAAGDRFSNTRCLALKALRLVFEEHCGRYL